MVKKNINQGFHTPPKDYYKVYVRSSTYNQSPYIEDCLNGVAMQKTNFPFVHHVVDDCSTDGEQEVIKSWIERECDLETAEYYDNALCTITLAKHKTNPNYTIAAYFLKKNMYGKPKKRELFIPWREVCPYIAICEGDDYWIDAKKLQKQVSLLDTNSTCVLVYSNVNIVDEYSNFIKGWKGYSQNIKEKLMCDSNFIPTVSTCFRADCYKNYLSILPQQSQSWKMGDLPLWIYLSAVGDVCYLEDVTAVYRILKVSASHIDNCEQMRRFYMSTYEIRVYMNELLCLGYSEKQIKAVFYKNMIAWCFDNKKYQFLFYAIKFFVENPFGCISKLVVGFKKRVHF